MAYEIVENHDVAYENHSDPSSCWCAWHIEVGDGRKHRDSTQKS